MHKYQQNKSISNVDTMIKVILRNKVRYAIIFSRSKLIIIKAAQIKVFNSVENY
jgi:hypothetical protein